MSTVEPTTAKTFELHMYIPPYSPVGRHYCKIDINHFATSFLKTKQRAKDACDYYDCDIIIQWKTRASTFRTQPGTIRRLRRVGYDIGKLDHSASRCPQNPDMTATIIWRKSI